ncbi:MAG: hypothetical protein CSA26_12130 [Desulfobacterales bacterium]|nr:MAG: hypothetical protein CSA26_12130 [Desulfobacterales bacterium]
MYYIKLLTIVTLATLMVSCAPRSQHKDNVNQHKKSVNTETPQATGRIAEALPTELVGKFPSPPPNFEWKIYHNAIFCAPKDWNEKESKTDDKGFQSFLYATSPENFSKEKPFEMGITVTVFTGCHAAKGLSVDNVAGLYLDPTIKSHTQEDIILSNINDENEDQKTIVFRYRDRVEGEKTVIIHKFIVADQKTDSVYIFIFESPEETWEKNWKEYGEPFLKKVTFAITKTVEK